MLCGPDCRLVKGALPVCANLILTERTEGIECSYLKLSTITPVFRTTRNHRQHNTLCSTHSRIDIRPAAFLPSAFAGAKSSQSFGCDIKMCYIFLQLGIHCKIVAMGGCMGTGKATGASSPRHARHFASATLLLLWRIG